jgi:serine/threonine-protein kinase
MTPERWTRIETLYHEALARPEVERAAFLAVACRDEELLLREIESLLSESVPDDFLAPPAPEVAVRLTPHVAAGAMAGQSVGGYQVGPLIGAGGMGEVYRARDIRLARDVAIKILPRAFTANPGRLARFEREARMLASLNHPLICAIYGIEEAAPPPGSGQPGIRALVMELVEGDDLSAHIGRGPMSLDAAMPIVRQIAEALEAAHEKGIVHRDLKPANVKITPEASVKILDFGLAKEAAATPATPIGGSEDGMILGTAAYLSPEQARGRDVDKRADIWAFGCVLYEMLSGRAAFAGDTVSDTIGRILEREPDWSLLPDATPEPVRRLIARCLVKDAKQRARDIGDVRIEIDALLSAASGTGAVASASSPARVRWLPWTGVGTLATALAVVVALWAPWRAVVPVRLRLTTELGPGVAMGAIPAQYGDATAISPDGGVIAFVGQPAGGGNPQLYVRRLDQLHATALSGTDYPGVPFFSPDGRWLGFWADGKLKKIAVTGGAAIPLADAPELRGGTWGEDGTIVFGSSRSTRTRLLRVSASGGPAEPLAALAEGEVLQSWPQILPGGKALLYSSSRILRAYNDANIVVQPLPAGAPKVVHRGGFHGRYVPSGPWAPRNDEGGHLVYIHDGTLFAAPFHLGRLEVTGPSVPVLAGVASNTLTGGAQFAVSASGTLVYRTGPMIGGGLTLSWMDRDGKTSPLGVTAAVWANLQFAPDGQRLAMEIRDGTTDIWVYELSRDTLTRLTTDPADDRKPVWTADGRRIAFASARGDKSTLNLHWQRSDERGAGAAERLTESANEQQPFSWHPSGRFLAFEEARPGTGRDVMILPVEGNETSGWKTGRPYAFVDGPSFDGKPMFSPDGRWLAYSSTESGSGRLEVHVRPFPGPGGTWQVSTLGGEDPVWSRSKPELFYSFNGQMSVAAYTVQGDVFRAGKPQIWSGTRFQTRGPGRMFDLHPDGKRFVLSPAVQTPGAGRLDQVTIVIDFFDELRRVIQEPNR